MCFTSFIIYERNVKFTTHHLIDPGWHQFSSSCIAGQHPAVLLQQHQKKYLLPSLDTHNKTLDTQPFFIFHLFTCCMCDMIPGSYLNGFYTLNKICHMDSGFQGKTTFRR